MTRSKLRERQWQLRESMIIDEAQKLLLEESYGSMTMDTLAARVGISKATLYQHFPSKEDLAINVVVGAIENTAAIVRGEAANASSPFERLVNALQTSLQQRLQFGQAGLILPAQVIKEHPRYQGAMREMSAIIGQVIDQAKADGCVKLTLKTAIIVPIIMAFVRADLEDMLQRAQTTPDELIDTMMSTLMYGLITHPAETPEPCTPTPPSTSDPTG